MPRRTWLDSKIDVFLEELVRNQLAAGQVIVDALAAFGASRDVLAQQIPAGDVPDSEVRSDECAYTPFVGAGRRDHHDPHDPFMIPFGSFRPDIVET